MSFPKYVTLSSIFLGLTEIPNGSGLPSKMVLSTIKFLISWMIWFYLAASDFYYWKLSKVITSSSIFPYYCFILHKSLPMYCIPPTIKSLWLLVSHSLFIPPIVVARSFARKSHEPDKSWIACFKPLHDSCLSRQYFRQKVLPPFCSHKLWVLVGVIQERHNNGGSALLKSG